MTYRTRQEIFDAAHLGLKAQKFRQSGDGVMCFYRGPNGLKCAVGHLIADEDYSPSLEEKFASNDDVLKAAKVSTDDAEFLSSLQDAHDGASTKKNMEKRLRNFAEHYGLTIPEDAA